jgi:hypothetical protein
MANTNTDTDPGAPPLTRRQVILFSLIAVTAGLLLCALLMEGVLRALGHRPTYLDADLYVPQPDGRTYGLRPGYRGLYAGGKVAVGPEGLRGELQPLSSRQGGILLLGDSANFGQGLDDHQTLAALLEARLRVPVINAGVPGYNSVVQLAQLRQLLPVVKPRQVILLYVLDNDTDLRPGVWVKPDGTLDLHLSQSLLGRVSRALTRHLVIYAKVRGLFRVKQAVLDADPGTPFAAGDPGWTASRQAVLAMRDLLREAGVPFAIGSIGLIQNLTAQPVLEAFCKEAGIPYAEVWHTRDMADFVKNRSLSSTDSHLNAATTAQMVDRLLPLVRR